MSTTKLLPCPFCGNTDITINNENPKDSSGGYFIACAGCGASTNLRFACGDDPIPLLAEQWNRRATVAVPDGWKLVPVQVPDSAFPWVSGGYSTDYRAHDPRDQKIIEDRAQRTWEAILDGIAAAPAADPKSIELEATEDMLSSARMELDMLRKALWVSVEPHQSLFERMIEAAESKAAARDALTTAARDVLAERARQISEEDWTPDHDDEHVNDEIAAMACFYLMPPASRDWDANSTSYGPTLGQAILPEGWYGKTGDRRRELVKGVALGLAEIERFDRAAIAAAKGK